MAEQFFGWSETSKRTIHGGDSPPSALFRTYCATKPVLAMEFIAKYGLVGLDAQPKSLRPDRRLTGVRVTVRDLLEHRVSGNSFGIADYLLTRREDRDRLLWQHIERDYGIAVRQRAAFSEIQAWTLLRVIVSRTEPEIVAQWFAPWAHEVMPIGCLDYSQIVPLTVLGEEATPMPILADLTPFMVEETSSLSLGVYHSARALGAFYRNVYEQMVEPTPPLFELPTRCSASQRAPQFHCGFRVNGSPFALSRYLSKNALGHCGAMGQSFGALDLELGFVVAACSNHVFANESDALSWRDRVVAKCFAAL